ncbi:MAG TPA: LUD domain-containing protein, partial [Solirubrobacteraceae bacterium]
MSTGELIWTDDPPFAQNAKHALANPQLRHNLRRASVNIRTRRDALVADTPDWEALRAAGAAIKDEVLLHLDSYLEQFERAATERGAQVHWARDADEAARVVGTLVQATGVRQVLKVKSMVTQEIALTQALAERGITA